MDGLEYMHIGSNMAYIFSFTSLVNLSLSMIIYFYLLGLIS